MKAKELTENYNVSTLKTFKVWKVGFLNPKGKLMPVKMYGHFEELKKYPEFHDEIEKYEDEIADAYNEFASGLDPDEHPEWHVFEIWQDDEEHELRQKILQKAYDLGWSRIGLISKRSNPHVLELETSGKNLSKLKMYAKDLAELLDAELAINSVDRFTD